MSFEHDVTVRARELIATEATWCKKSFHKDAAGRDVSIGGRSHCSWGAVSQAAWELEDILHYADYASVIGALTKVAKEQFPERGQYHDLLEFNDHPDTTHEDVLMVFDKVIADLDATA